MVNQKSSILRLGISSKLFIAFWLVLFISVFISYLVTIQFRHAPNQEVATPEHLTLLNQYTKKLANKKQIKLSAIQSNFFRKHKQHLIIKKIANNKIMTLRNRGWSTVKEYLRSNTLNNPVTIDFVFTKVTSSAPIMINSQKFQIFVADEIQRKRIVGWVNQLPLAIRMILLLTLSFICCWWLSKSFSGPLIAIQKASKKLGEGKLTTRISKFDLRSDEFGALARSFNQMAEQLEDNISAHQRLLGDVSHELRSPLTRLQLAVALAEKNIGNSVEQQKHLTRCETEVDRLDEMIADVLTLARLEHSHNAFTAEKIDLHNLMKQVVADCQYFASSKDVTITFDNSVRCTLMGDSKLLVSAISNIVNNAIKYSPTKQSIEVILTKEISQVVLSVTDHGPGVPTETLDKLFTPFFRVAESRERSSGGTGLGLAIAQQAVCLHQGTIRAENLVTGGLKVTIKLPFHASNTCR